VSGPVITDTTCGAFRRLRPESLQPGRVHRFVVGEDTAVRVLTQAEAARELGDPFATLLLLRGVFPRTAGEVLEALDRAAPAGDPLRRSLFFLVGEGSQIPMTPRPRRSIGICGSSWPVGSEPRGPTSSSARSTPTRGTSS
jgi:hypothetical protein